MTDNLIDWPNLKPDCEACAALCCVVFPFDKSESFGIDKAAGEVCPNLTADNKCQIFSNRESLGFKGCIAYDCFGAGQVVSQQIFQGKSWREQPELKLKMGEALSVLRRVHEQLLLLQAAEKMRLTEQENLTLHGLVEKALSEKTRDEDLLNAFPIEQFTKEVSDFLIGLRHHIT